MESQLLDTEEVKEPQLASEEVKESQLDTEEVKEPQLASEEVKDPLLTIKDVQELLGTFSTASYDASDDNPPPLVSTVQENCEKLFNKDYVCYILENTKGIHCSTYPSRIMLPEAQKGAPEDTEKFHEEKTSEAVAKYNSQITAHKPNLGRCRMRFPVPVILYDGKFICRSATLSVGKEVYSSGLSSVGADLMACSIGPWETSGRDKATEDVDAETSTENDVPDVNAKKYSYGVPKYRQQDVQLLRELSVSNICDLMVEEKKEKFWIYVSSSEYADGHQMYRDFTIWSMPYPGCEFFTLFAGKHYSGKDMYFDWSEPSVNRTFDLPPALTESLGIDFSKYKEWNINKLTVNYVKAILMGLTQEPSGILVHCISGWDRTPLFISLLRMSLWADEVIHSSLTPLEMLYLTIGYDWFLFGHQLPVRLDKNEQIMGFCFYVLKHLCPPEFSVLENLRVPSPGTDSRPGSPSGAANVSGESTGSFLEASYVLIDKSECPQAEEDNLGNPRPTSSPGKNESVFSASTSGSSLTSAAHRPTKESEQDVSPGGPQPDSKPASPSDVTGDGAGSALEESSHAARAAKGSSPRSLRKEKLQELRKIFMECYFSCCKP